MRGIVRVLVVEDDAKLRRSVTAALRSAALAVDDVGDLMSADVQLSVNSYDCVVLDRRLPERPDSVDTVDAVVALREWREKGREVPVLILSALDDERPGLLSGADDYVIKPFKVDVLILRVLNLVRRRGVGRSPVLRYDDLEMDTARREVRRAGVLLGLTAKEFAVLEYLLTRPEHVVTRTELIDACWDGDVPGSNTVDQTIRRLRRKLHGSQLIQTVPGHGYRLSRE